MASEWPQNRQPQLSEIEIFVNSGLYSQPSWVDAMITVGAFEAKTQLSALPDRVAAGEEVVITRHGRPIARLVAADRAGQARANKAFTSLKELRKGTTLDGISWKELRDAGRP